MGFPDYISTTEYVRQSDRVFDSGIRWSGYESFDFDIQEKPRPSIDHTPPSTALPQFTPRSYDWSDELKLKQIERVTVELDEAALGDDSPSVEYITGWRLHAITFSLCLGLFIGQMEISILSTSLVAITDHLGGFEKSSWLFTAYMLTYSGLLIIWSKMSDIFGRKATLLVCYILFVAFSAASGVAQTIDQLIMFRWCQGAAGSGMFGLATVLFFELVPPEKYPTYTAICTGTIAISLTTAPLIGGAVVERSSWRWIFLINVPAGVLTLVSLSVLMPRYLSNEAASLNARIGVPITKLKRIDILGAASLAGSCVLIATALQQQANGLSFTDLKVLPLMVCSGALAVLFVIWQWYLTTRRTFPEPVFPWRFFQNRVALGMILNTYLTGSVLTVAIVQIPQRFTVVNGLSPLAAGIRLLPFGVLVPGGSTIAAGLMGGKARIAPIYILLVGAVMELAGVIGLSTIFDTSKIHASQYGFQILAGAGVGFFNAALTMMVPFVMEKRDLAVGNGAVAQFRSLGGLLALAIVTSATSKSLQGNLMKLLPAEQVVAVLSSTNFLNQLPDETQSAVRVVFNHTYNSQMQILIGFAIAQFPAIALMWKKKPIVVVKQ